MTDGIIQKVFNKYHRHYLRENYSNIDYESLFRAIEQQLIEEIKKKLSHKTSDMCEYQDLSLHRIVDILIGDKND